MVKWLTSKIDDVIDFYNMSVECGEAALDLIKLHKQKRKTT